MFRPAPVVLGSRCEAIIGRSVWGMSPVLTLCGQAAKVRWDRVGGTPEVGQILCDECYEAGREES